MSMRSRAVVCLVVWAIAHGLPGQAVGAPLSIEAQPGAPIDPDEMASVYAVASELELSVFEEKDLEPSDAIDRLTRAALLFERVGDLEQGVGPGYWRASRAVWLAGERLPLDDIDGRMVRFQRSLVLADRGLAADPDCADCMLWKFISMGRLRTTQGLWEGMRQVKDMADLLDRAIELDPQTRDSAENSTLGNLHYSAAIFYRVVPDWFWLRWMLGVRGDKERALRHSRTALALHPNRFDYQVEVGTQLLCLGSDRGDAKWLDEGRVVLEQAVARKVDTERERREIHFAKLMLENPGLACGYTGDKLFELDEEEARSKSR
jgi:tetratricopeptide (TPR) repeat protein